MSLTNIQQKLRKGLRDPREIYKFVQRRYETAQSSIKERFFWDRYYAQLDEPKVKSSIKNDPHDYEEIVRELKQNNFAVIDYTINIDDYHDYLRLANYERFPGYNSGTGVKFTEKSLEHYLAATLLKLSQHDVYIDIANAASPVPEIYHELYGSAVFRQDLIFPPGINGSVIGGDAGAMPVKNAFATKMALHCSFEHFEQDADIRFIKEAGRVLAPGGKLCIVPLYLFKEYAIQTDPVVLPPNTRSFEPGVTLYCARGYRERHGRFSDISHLVSRIKSNLHQLRLTIYVVQNAKAIDTSCYVKFIALFEKY